MKVALVVARDQQVVGLRHQAERGEGAGAGAQAVGKHRGADSQHLVGGEGGLAEREQRGKAAEARRERRFIGSVL